MAKKGGFPARADTGAWGSDLNLGAPDPMYFQRRQEATMPSQGGGGGVARVLPGGRVTTSGYARQPSAGVSPSMRALTGYGGGVQEPSAVNPTTDRDALWAREDRLRAEDQARKTDMLGRVSSLFNTSSGPRVSRTEGPSAEQEQAKRGAAFARAKETAGQNARASMQTLQDVVDERGLMGSSVEAGQAGAIIGGAADETGDFLREQAIGEADQATHVADIEYQGQVAQRAQEMARKQALMGLLAGGALY